MDIRGVEITNQLRSAIRAKLLELGVKYDEELPDYILVMVVNKKSRQQMNEDLNLFLEDSTEPFVNWLHDQVLKKLQKVTVAKKKVNKDITSSVKQEGEEKKLKTEKSEKSPISKEPVDVVTKQERDREFEELVGDLALLNEEDSKDSCNGTKNKSQRNKITIHASDFEDSNDSQNHNSFTPTKAIPESLNTEKNIRSPTRITQSEISNEKSIVTPERASHFDITEKNDDQSSTSLKRTSNVIDNISDQFDVLSAKQSKLAGNTDSDSSHKIKSLVSKPKITSVVTVKTKIDISPNKQRDLSSKSVSSVRNKNDSGSHRHSNLSRSKSADRKKSDDSRAERSKNDKNDKSRRFGDSREKERSREKPGNIKSRLGIFHKQEKPLKPSSTTRVSKQRISNVKSRLGSRPKQVNRDVSDLVLKLKHSNKRFDEEDDDTASVINTSLKSQVIAIQKPKLTKPKQKTEQNRSSQSTKIHNVNKETKKVEDNTKSKEDDQCAVPSKVIVTPRPLKPLQPFQKRATQSLLLKAVAEANQSVVLQKKIDPCLKEQKVVNKIKITKDLREGRILSVNFNPKKKLMTERIQIELSNQDRRKPKKSSLSKLNNKHLDVVKSLFQRSDDKQKFLVTLNGYNNNDHENRNSDDEQFEIEANEDGKYFDYNQYESYSENHEMIEDHEESDIYGDEDHQDNYNNYTKTEHDQQQIEIHKSNNSENSKLQSGSSSKRQKLSPIVYNITRSGSPGDLPSLESAILNIDKKPLISSVITTLPDKSNEKCRYWPKCDLGIKCAYFHPDVPCSSFPACKFGDKCAYKHPKCKFGSACTKLNCIFSHPPMQCKYHPYCMKPGCQFSHPKTASSSPLSPLAPLPPDISTLKAKFTWKKKESV